MKLVKKIVIVGGDTVAPMVAAAIANSLRGQEVSITIVDGPAVSRSAHSTLPQTVTFHSHLGVSHRDLLRQTNATFKLGLDYTDWVQPDHIFLHPYGDTGVSLRLVPFHHYFIKKRQAGDLTEFSTYSLAAAAAKIGNFTLPVKEQDSILSTFAYGLHVDAGQYAAFFRDYARGCGVVTVDGGIANFVRRPADGFIASVTLKDGSRIDGDLFVDCSGDRAVLIDGVLDQKYADWSCYIPCDRSLVLSAADVPELSPLTFMVRKKVGWLRRIPMRDRSDYELFYSSQLTSDDDAEASLRRDLGRTTVGETLTNRFVNGRRESFWHKNCIAIGRSAGFIEPLESSNLYLAQSAVLRLMSLFPDRSCDPIIATEYNRLLGLEYDQIRDFVSLFYTSARHEVSEFWNQCQFLKIPDSLTYRLNLFKSHGRLAWYEEETFPKEYWVSALLGLGKTPSGYDPLADVPDGLFLDKSFEKMRSAIQEAARQMPSHQAFIENSLSA